MDTHSIEYNSSDTKAELIEKIDAYVLENGMPIEEVSYTYMEEVVDTTTDHEATIQDLLDREPLYFAPRISPDNSEICIKGDWTKTELDAMPNDFRIYTNEECKEYIATTEAVAYQFSGMRTRMERRRCCSYSTGYCFKYSVYRNNGC
jgi:hypothetical protein